MQAETITSTRTVVKVIQCYIKFLHNLSYKNTKRIVKYLFPYRRTSLKKEQLGGMYISATEL